MARQILIIDDNVSDSNEIKRHLPGLRAEIYQALRIGMAKEDNAALSFYLIPGFFHQDAR